jgi:hypothetical protein
MGVESKDSGVDEVWKSDPRISGYSFLAPCPHSEMKKKKVLAEEAGSSMADSCGTKPSTNPSMALLEPS